ncbi:conserved protein of unknown function(Protein of unknown function DUF2076,1-227) [Magnetospirillum sp. XM-1]|uniref:DUF2076 domain-containing protein n=1 Tax=Magnetospirillum sp. XM-1 TaxID=1663591 RepID=UPI00073DFDEF|nr:DUF2076 domain-containing protein [Magnetospirillum sp. XM-1]CUW38229.1 conserved protein of unknown function(Protein of unknown function DUF2076,1-227) [Magnetospirillum sp. XM-1]
MTPSERDLILSVFDRLSKLAGGPKDREAEALIVERLRAVPDAAYNLVEAVVVQEMAIKENEARIRDLEARLAGQSQPQQPGGGFGRGAWGGGRGSVPATQAPQQQVQQQQYAPPPQQQYAQQPSPWGGQPSAGGGFLRTAAGAAVGVAGGMLLANSISSMFAGGHGGSSAGTGAQTAGDTTINNYYGSSAPAGDTAAQPSYDTTIADDQSYGDFDPGYDVGGGDDSF